MRGLDRASALGRVALVCASMFLGACRQQHVSLEVFSVRSPDQSRVATVLVDYPPVIAAPRPENYYLVVAEAGKPILELDPRAAVWRSNAVPPLYVFWTDDSHLEVLIQREWSSRFSGIRTKGHDGVEVTTRIVRSTQKDALFSEELETFPVASQKDLH